VAKLQLHQLLAWPSLNGLPLVVLGNKNDKECALSEKDLINTMELGSIKDRVVAVYSVSCKNMINIDKVLKMLSDFKPKKK
jgi:ADP-ribosylation factor-like protein 8